MSSSGSSESAGQRSAVFHPHQVRRKVRGGLFKALKRTFRHKFLLGLLCLVSLGAGYLAAQAFGTSWWIAKLDLRIDGQMPAGSALGLEKILPTLARHPETLVKAIKKLDAGFTKSTKRQIERNLSVEVNSTPARVSIHLKSIDPDAAKALLSALNEAMQSYIAAARNARSGGDDAAAQLAKLQGEIDPLRQAKQELLIKGGGSDLSREMASIKNTIAMFEDLLQADRAKEVAAKEQYKELLRQLDDLKNLAAREAEYESDDAVMADSINDNRHRQQRIRELVRDEKERIGWTASLEAKLKERKQQEDLLKGGKGPLAGLAAQAFGPANLIRLDSEIHVLKANLEGNRATIELDNELRKIDKLIVPKKGKPMPISPIITQMLDKKLDRELVMLGLTREIDHFQKEIDSHKAKLVHLQSVEAKSSDLDKKIASLEQERTALQSRSADAEQDAFTLTPLGEPTTDAFADGSNRPAIFTTIFLSGSGLSLLAVLLYELVMGIRLPADVAKSLRIPVRWIAASPKHSAADYRDLCRIVRSQGFLAKTILQVQPLNQGAEAQTKTAQAIEGLAKAFILRGEKVLIVDLGQTDPETAGLSDMLLAADEPIERFVRSTTDSGLSRMTAGRQRLSAVQVADASLRVLLEKALQTFQVILLQGQGLQATREVEALGLAADGLAIVSNGNRKIDPIAREALLDLTAENLVPRAVIII